jgi:hypothetical protein
MPKVIGIVQNVRIDQEGGSFVLRFTAQTDDDERIPVEMRGKEVLGVLEPGDQVAIVSRRARDKYGVTHPKRVENLTTKSIVRVKKPGVIKRFVSFVFSLATSIATAVLTSYVTKAISPEPVAEYRYAPGYEPSLLEPLLRQPIVLVVGLAVGLLVFYFMYIRPKRS